MNHGTAHAFQEAALELEGKEHHVFELSETRRLAPVWLDTRMRR